MKQNNWSNNNDGCILNGDRNLKTVYNLIMVLTDVTMSQHYCIDVQIHWGNCDSCDIKRYAKFLHYYTGLHM